MFRLLEELGEAFDDMVTDTFNDVVDDIGEYFEEKALARAHSHHNLSKREITQFTFEWLEAAANPYCRSLYLLCADADEHGVTSVTASFAAYDLDNGFDVWAHAPRRYDLRHPRTWAYDNYDQLSGPFSMSLCYVVGRAFEAYGFDVDVFQSGYGEDDWSLTVSWPHGGTDAVAE